VYTLSARNVPVADGCLYAFSERLQHRTVNSQLRGFLVSLPTSMALRAAGMKSLQIITQTYSLVLRPVCVSAKLRVPQADDDRSVAGTEDS